MKKIAVIFLLIGFISCNTSKTIKNLDFAKIAIIEKKVNDEIREIPQDAEKKIQRSKKEIIVTYFEKGKPEMYYAKIYIEAKSYKFIYVLHPD